MKELKDAAAHLGLRLRGVSLPREPGVIDRPILAFLQGKSHGHFVVVRPTGHTGHLVQIIDDVGDPRVIDSTRLFAEPWWTSTALVPPRTNWSPIFILCGLLPLVGLTGLRRKVNETIAHRKSRTPENEPPSCPDSGSER